MAGNRNLNSAARAKKDKFYTQMEDIENELRHYRDFFKDKIVLCNCDDPFESNFFQYFALMFNTFELKKLITTSYADSPIAGLELVLPGMGDGKKAYQFEADSLQDWNGDGREDLEDVKFAIEHGIYKMTPLTGDMKYCAGDFRSKECIELLKQADVVVTNPPFSLFREYVAQLVDYDKKFLIIGNMNAITYKEVFKLIMQNKVWLGESIQSGDRKFYVPDDYPLEAANCGIDEEGKRFLRIKGVRWFTNIKISKVHEYIPLYKKQSPEENPRYDNYDAIEVSKTAEIPEDYYGVMGVPITFLDKYDPRQFEILGATESEGVGFSNGLWHDDSQFKQATINGKKVYKRIFVKRRS